MSHSEEDRNRLLARAKRIRGQAEAVERALESDTDHTAVLQLIASVRGALNGLMAELVEHHLTMHVVGDDDPRARREGAEDLARFIRTYLK